VWISDRRTTLAWALQAARPDSLHWRKWPKASRPRTKCRRRPVNPVLALREPGAIAVMVVPIGTYTETGNANAQHGTVTEHGNVPALVGITDVGRIDPTAIRTGRDITPPIVIQTSFNLYRDTGRNDGDDREIPRRSGTKIDVFRRVTHLLRVACQWCHSQNCRKCA
jgi:hypothetical protein